MNLDKKLELAEKVLIAIVQADNRNYNWDAEGVSALSFEVADAMEAEYNKRKTTGLPEALQEKPKQHQCNCAHWKGGSTFMGETHTCSSCGGWVMI